MFLWDIVKIKKEFFEVNIICVLLWFVYFFDFDIIEYIYDFVK